MAFSAGWLKMDAPVGLWRAQTKRVGAYGGAPVTAARWPRAGFRSAVSKMLRKVLVNFAVVEVGKRRQDALDQNAFLAVYHINQAAARTTMA